MKRRVQVRLGESARPVGEIRYDRQGSRESAAFSYDSQWLAHPHRFAIDPALGLVSGFQFHARQGTGSIFHGAVADTQPDGWGRKIILRDHAKRRKSAISKGHVWESDALGELDFLLAVDDESRVGALRFFDEEDVVQASGVLGSRRAPPLIELQQLLNATRAVEMSEETQQDLEYLRGHGTSLGGLRPKCSLRDIDGSLAIGKFPSVADERSVTKGEVLALSLARRAGISVVDARVVVSEGIPVAVIRRFDRTDKFERIPYISAATMLGVTRDDPNEHTYTELVDSIRIHGHDAQADIEELYRRIAFSILINNVDDHLHNHGFLHTDHGQWRLAPAFDINPFPHRARELKTWISDDTGPNTSIEALIGVAPYFRLDSLRSEAIVNEVVAAVSTWREVGAQIGMNNKELDAFIDAFDDPYLQGTRN